MTKRTALFAVSLALLIAAAFGWRGSSRAVGQTTPAVHLWKTPGPNGVATSGRIPRVIDEADFIGEYEASRVSATLDGLYDESGVDIRFIFARDIPGSIESYALERARTLGVGRDTDRRGLLFVYDVSGRRMRIEVGPGLQGIFPDGFVGFLMREQTAAFFEAGNRHLALKSTLDVVTRQLREASLGGSYNPRAIAYIKSSKRLAEGGGANARADEGRGRDLQALRTGVSSEEVRVRFGPQPTVAGAHARYLEALRDGYYQPDLPLYTDATQAVLRNFPTAAPFAQMLILSEYGHGYKIVERGDYAILFFTTTPLVSAHLFHRSPGGWQLDLASEVRDTREFVGSAYTWTMVPSGDIYSILFADQFADFGATRLSQNDYRSRGVTRFLRPAKGDNRPLPTRAPHSLPAPIAPLSFTFTHSLLLPADASHSEDFGYPTQAINQLAVRRLLILRSFDALDTLLTAYSDSVRRDYRLEYRLFDAYAALDVAMPSLEQRLNEWVRARPSSAPAHLARATFLRASGWNARGSASAGATSRDRFKRMNEFFRRASSDLNVALSLEPNSIDAYYQLMDIAKASGDGDACRQFLARGLGIQIYSFVLRDAYMRNLLPRWNGSYEAMAEFAIESMPYAIHNPRIRALGGFVDWDRGRVLGKEHKAKAIEAYTRALGYGDYWLFHYQRGALYSRSDQPKEALVDLNRALAQYPQDADALYRRARVTYDLGRDKYPTGSGPFFSQAYRDIELAAALDPTDDDYREELVFIRKAIPEFEPPNRP